MAWLLLLNIKSMKFNHVVTCYTLFILVAFSIQLYDNTTIHGSALLLMQVCVVSHLELLWTFLCISVGEHMCTYLLSILLGMKLLSHGVCAYMFMFIDMAYQFPKLVISISTPTCSIWDFQLLHISTTLDVASLFHFSHPGGWGMASHCRMVFLKCKANYFTLSMVFLLHSE